MDVIGHGLGMGLDWELLWHRTNTGKSGRRFIMRVERNWIVCLDKHGMPSASAYIFENDVSRRRRGDDTTHYGKGMLY